MGQFGVLIHIGFGGGSSSGCCLQIAPEVVEAQPHSIGLTVRNFPSVVGDNPFGVSGIPIVGRGISTGVPEIHTVVSGSIVGVCDNPTVACVNAFPSVEHTRRNPSVVFNSPLAASRALAVVHGFLLVVGDFNFVVRDFLSAMSRPRQLMLSRRGSGRGNPSHPSVGSSSMGQAPPPLGTESILRPSQFLDPDSPGSSNSPSFGYAIFSFNCSPNRPRITAHVSILFLEEAQEEGELSAPLPHTEEDQNPNSPRPSTDMQHGTSQPASAINIVPVAHAQPDRQEHEDGWCRIVEEPPDE